MPATNSNPKSDSKPTKDSLPNKHRLPATISRSSVVHERRGQNSLVLCETWKQDPERIGTGASGSVFLQRRLGSTHVRAVKKLWKDNLERQGVNVVRELTNLISVMDRPDLFVRFLGWYENDDFLFYAMEYVEHGDLEQYMRTNGPQVKENAREISRQLLEGLAVLHQKKISHRDLKPPNVLVASLNPIHVKLADFGLSKCEEGTIMVTSKIGTMGYLAPEVLRLLPEGALPGRQYTNAIDMWAFGCIVHVMLASEGPFATNGRFDLGKLTEFYQGQTQLVDIKLVASTKNFWIVDFVRKLLVLDGHKRMSASNALKHTWISDDEASVPGMYPIVVSVTSREHNSYAQVLSANSMLGPSPVSDDLDIPLEGSGFLGSTEHGEYRDGQHTDVDDQSMYTFEEEMSEGTTVVGVDFGRTLSDAGISDPGRYHWPAASPRTGRPQQIPIGYLLGPSSNSLGPNLSGSQQSSDIRNTGMSPVMPESRPRRIQKQLRHVDDIFGTSEDMNTPQTPRLPDTTIVKQGFLTPASSNFTERLAYLNHTQPQTYPPSSRASSLSCECGSDSYQDWS